MDNPDDTREAPANPSRRRILAGGIAATAGAVASPVLAQVKPLPGAPAINRNLPDVVVIGAGAFGGWTALSLREAGAKVTLVDAYGPGNPRASSGDESRLLRLSYGGREIYTKRSEEHTSELQSLMRISYAVFCLKKNK